MRTLGLYRLAEQSLPSLAPDVRRALDDYAAGVNAFLTSHSGAMPGEFILLHTTPEPWRAADSLVWGRLMALQLSGMLLRLAEAGVRSQYPAASEEEVLVRVAARHLDPDTVTRVYGWCPDAHL